MHLWAVTLQNDVMSTMERSRFVREKPVEVEFLKSSQNVMALCRFMTQLAFVDLFWICV